MKVPEQCDIAASKCKITFLGWLGEVYHTRRKKLIIPMYKAIVMPHLEYCIQDWRPHRKNDKIPHRKKDIDTLERIQRRATKIIPEVRYLSYEERLKKCCLTTLQTRRLRGDQI